MVGRPNKDASVIERFQFRNAMAQLGAAVNVITTTGTGGWLGFTASAVCSVTDDPPTMLVCMNRGSVLNEEFKAAGVLCVNTLASVQEPLSELFAGVGSVPMAERFGHAAWSVLETGAPVLDGAVASVDCRIVQVTEVGTHSVMFCEAVACRVGEAREGLIYFGRAYHRVAAA